MKSLKRVVTALKIGFRKLSPNCREANRLQSEALDHRLAPPQRFGLRLHLLLCKWCRRYGKQIRFLHNAVREHPDEMNAVTPQTLSLEARERLKQSLRNQPK